MIISNINDMIKGWFIGNFEPSLYKTNDVEVAWKKYHAGDNEDSHYHKMATEYTVITKGKVLMNEIEYVEGDIVVIEPGESTDFVAIQDSETFVIKIPGASNDKYLSKEGK